MNTNGCSYFYSTSTPEGKVGETVRATKACTAEERTVPCESEGRRSCSSSASFCIIEVYHNLPFSFASNRKRAYLSEGHLDLRRAPPIPGVLPVHPGIELLEEVGRLDKLWPGLSPVP